MTRIVTSTCHYKRPPKKRAKAAAIDGLAGPLRGYVLSADRFRAHVGAAFL